MPAVHMMSTVGFLSHGYGDSSSVDPAYLLPNGARSARIDLPCPQQPSMVSFLASSTYSTRRIAEYGEEGKKRKSSLSREPLACRGVFPSAASHATAFIGVR